MGALITIHNDGPDEIEVRIGGRWVRLAAGESTRTNATVPVEANPLPKLDPAALAVDLGHTPGEAPKPPCRLAND